METGERHDITAYLLTTNRFFSNIGLDSILNASHFSHNLLLPVFLSLNEFSFPANIDSLSAKLLMERAN